MRQKNPLAGVLVAVAVVVLYFALGGDRETPPSEAPSTPGATGAAPAAGDVVAEPPEAAPAREAALVDSAAGGELEQVGEHPLRDQSASLAVHVTWARTSEPAAGVRMALAALNTEDLREAITDGAGRAFSRGSAPGSRPSPRIAAGSRP